MGIFNRIFKKIIKKFFLNTKTFFAYLKYYKNTILLFIKLKTNDEKNIFTHFTFIYKFFQAQLNEKIIDKWQLNTTVTTEFTDSETSNKQVADNILKYKYLQDSNWTFKKDGKFEAKLKDGKLEKGSYSANEDRFLIIFDKESIEEFNTTNVVTEPKKVTLTIGRGMTKLTMNFEKK